jgi:hypothetical protein
LHIIAVYNSSLVANLSHRQTVALPPMGLAKRRSFVSVEAIDWLRTAEISAMSRMKSEDFATTSGNAQ